MPLSDILACEEDQVEAIVSNEDPYASGAWFKAKNIGMIELARLGELLGVDSYDALTDGFNLVGEPLPEGPWPQTIPAGLTHAIARLSEEQVASISQKWAAIEEFDGSAVDEGLADYLRRLRGFLSSNPGPYFLVNAL